MNFHDLYFILGNKNHLIKNTFDASEAVPHAKDSCTYLALT